MFGRRNFRTAVLTLVCVVGMFLFPAAIGSFAATHGPVTAMRASKQARQVKVAMFSSAITVPIATFTHPQDALATAEAPLSSAQQVLSALLCNSCSLRI